MTSNSLSPRDVADVVDAVRAAKAAKTPMEILGGGSKRGLGRPVEAALTLDTLGLSGVTLYEPEELVMTVRAGTPLTEIEETLAASRQHLAFEPVDLCPALGTESGRQTIGGVLACGLSGPRRPAAGAARDHFLGLEAVTGFGEVVHAGGRVVKNVTGYDLSKLFAGSYGTLGILTEVTVKVMPMPETTATVLLSGLEDADAVAAMRAAATSPLEVSGAVHLPAWATAGIEALGDRAAAAVTALRLEGFAQSVADRRQSLAALLARFGAADSLEADASRAFWTAMRRLQPALARPDHALWRLSVPPAAGAGGVSALTASIPADCYYDWGGGLIWCLTEKAEDSHQAVRKAAMEAGGHATLIRAGAKTRGSIGAFAPQEPGKAALTRRIKDSFDPETILNPGRLYPEA